MRDYSRLAATAFSRDRVACLTVLVAGAGALGNEVIKNLTLMGVGRVLIVDRDRVEPSNLTRSVLFCTPDIERHLARATWKVELAAQRVGEMNPDVQATPYAREIADVGLGIVRQADVVFSCLDNEMARLELSWMCTRVNRPLIDGGLSNVDPSSGMVSLFPGAEGPCYACRKSAERRRELLWALQGREDPCWAKEQSLADRGLVATTPLMASVVGACQVELGLRRYLDGSGSPRVGTAHRITMHPAPALQTRTFEQSPSCPLHDPDSRVREVHERADRCSSQWTVAALLSEVGGERRAVLRLDWPIAARAVCHACGRIWEPLVRRARLRHLACPDCSSPDVAETEVITELRGDSLWASRTLAALGLPLAHIHEVVVECGDELRSLHVEVTGDKAVGATEVQAC